MNASSSNLTTADSMGELRGEKVVRLSTLHISHQHQHDRGRSVSQEALPDYMVSEWKYEHQVSRGYE